MSTSNYLSSATASLTSLLSVGTNPSGVDHQNQLSNGKVTLSGGKIERTFKPPGKPQTVKDEVVIRNSDSGKGKLNLFNQSCNT